MLPSEMPLGKWLSDDSCQRQPGSRLLMKHTRHSKSPMGTGKRRWDKTGNLLSETRASLAQLTYILQVSIDRLAKTCINNESISAEPTTIPCWWEQVISSHQLLHHQPQMLNTIPKHIRFDLQKAFYRPECIFPDFMLDCIYSSGGEKSKVLNDQHNPHLWKLIKNQF